MSLTGDIKSKVYTTLSAILETLKKESTETPTNTTYCEYSLETTTPGFIDNKESKNKTLIIDVWGTSATANLITFDTVCDSINTAFDSQIFSGTDYAFISELTARNDNIATGEENVRHTQFNFNLRHNIF